MSEASTSATATADVSTSATRYLEETIRDRALAAAALWLVLKPHIAFSLDRPFTGGAPSGPDAPQERND